MPLKEKAAGVLCEAQTADFDASERLHGSKLTRKSPEATRASSPCKDGLLDSCSDLVLQRGGVHQAKIACPLKFLLRDFAILIFVSLPETLCARHAPLCERCRLSLLTLISSRTPARRHWDARAKSKG
jgi:hypothetical protein